MWAATLIFTTLAETKRFQSTRPVWAATGRCVPFVEVIRVSIHAARVGRDSLEISGQESQYLFQSTRPVWAATGLLLGQRGPVPGFNPRGPCGPRLGWLRIDATRSLVSIHAARVGRDHERRANRSGPWKFQSTRPVWAATLVRNTIAIVNRQFQSTRPVWAATQQLLFSRDAQNMVSIHAARVGRDVQKVITMTSRICFNPRGPCGPRRRLAFDAWESIQSFNPRGPCGPRRTDSGKVLAGRRFNPRGPCGPRHAYFALLKLSVQVSIHAARVGRDSSSLNRLP